MMDDTFASLIDAIYFISIMFLAKEPHPYKASSYKERKARGTDTGPAAAASELTSWISHPDLKAAGLAHRTSIKAHPGYLKQNHV